MFDKDRTILLALIGILLLYDIISCVASLNEK
jgi:hypothetical protein